MKSDDNKPRVKLGDKFRNLTAKICHPWRHRRICEKNLWKMLLRGVATKLRLSIRDIFQ